VNIHRKFLLTCVVSGQFIELYRECPNSPS